MTYPVQQTGFWPPKWRSVRLIACPQSSHGNCPHQLIQGTGRTCCSLRSGSYNCGDLFLNFCTRTIFQLTSLWEKLLIRGSIHQNKSQSKPCIEKDSIFRSIVGHGVHWVPGATSQLHDRSVAGGCEVKLTQIFLLQKIRILDWCGQHLQMHLENLIFRKI